MIPNKMDSKKLSQVDSEDNHDFDLSASMTQTISDTAMLDNIEKYESNYDNSTSAVLNYCKFKVLQPYFRLLSLIGWRQIFSSESTLKYFSVFKAINLVYFFLVIFLVLVGYFLQYCLCYRSDGLGNAEPKQVLSLSPNLFTHQNYSRILNSSHVLKLNLLRNLEQSFKSSTDQKVLDVSASCSSKLISVYIIPDLLHLTAYLYVLYLMRTPECEKLENLMERGFLQTSTTAGWIVEHKKLVHTLRSFLWLCVIWVLVSFALHLLNFSSNPIKFSCLHDNLKTWFQSSLIILTVISLLFHDIISSAMIMGYAVHCQLNISYLYNICRGIREKRIDFEEFYKRVEDSRKFVDYLNTDQSVGVSLLLINFIIRVAISFYEILIKEYNNLNLIMITINSILWILLFMIPIIQAVRLTDTCNSIKKIGHELKSRPFGYQDTHASQLDSFLLYTSSLNMKAKIFFIPIQCSYTISILLIILILVPILGQLNVVNI